MAVAIVTIICIAMIVAGGMTLSQGILTSADTAAISTDKISVREGEIMRTDLETVRAAQLSWADYLRVTVINNGQTKLSSFDKWDVIVSYIDSGGTLYSKWLPYTTSLPVDNEWQKARIGLNGPVEFFEPGILNPSEEMVALIHLDPTLGDATSGDVSIATPNGVYNSIPVFNLGYTRLTAQSENITIANTKYYELVEAAPADGAAIISRTEFSTNESARKLLYNADQPTRPAKHIYPFIGISEIPAATWTVYYRGFVAGGGGFPYIDNDVRFNIDIVIRKADGSLRATIATAVASAWVEPEAEGAWMTFSATYDFPGYTVVDENDYLEIDYYGQTSSGPNSESGYMQLSIDDNTLPESEQTRIEA
jgi:archaellum component FlaF (FlaF/FlaG flagellin family)